jgi:hypothetical protein
LPGDSRSDQVGQTVLVPTGPDPVPSPPDGGSPNPGPESAPTKTGRQRASGIYGTIVAAAVIAAGGNHLSAAALAVTVVVTLVIYWLAEQYAELLAEHTVAGRLPSRKQMRSSLAETWPMVTASYLPVASLFLARLSGASSTTAARDALGVTILLLAFYGFEAGRTSELRGIRLFFVTAVAALLGVAMVVLKVLLARHH